MGVHECKRVTATAEGAQPAHFSATATGFALDCWPDPADHRPGEWRATLCGVSAVGDFEGEVQLSVTAPLSIEWSMAESTLAIDAATPTQ